MIEQDIPPTFVQYAADILADTNKGLSGTNIVRATVTYALEYHVNLPHPTSPLNMITKRQALYENLMAFSAPQRYRIIKELCDHQSFGLIDSPERKKLKLVLIQRYSHLDPKDTASEVNDALVEETKHWLKDFPAALALYSQALEKHAHGAFNRNVLDDLRLSLEVLLKTLLQNDKSLENQLSAVGQLIKTKGGSPELSNMFVKLMDYYAKYQNSYVKHDDAVNEQEIDFILEISSSFMKHLIRIK